MSSRKVEIDVLRGIAVLLVVFFHFNKSISFGWIGVDLFFVLSGYLVSSLVFNEHKRNGSVNVKRFFIRRGFKIYPLYFLFMLCTLVCRLLAEEQIPLRTFFCELFFLRNYFGGFWAHTWSLCVEEHFYILLSLFAFVACTRSAFIKNVKAVNCIFLLVCAFCLAFRLASLLLEQQYGASRFFNEWARGVHTHSRIDSLLCGVFLAYNMAFNEKNIVAFYTRNSLFIRMFALAAGVIAILFAASMDFNTTVGYSLLWLAFGVLLFETAVTGTIKNFVLKKQLLPFFKLIAFAGVNSYAIYLFHPMVRDYLLHIPALGLDEVSMTSFFVYFALSILIGYISTRAVEAQFLKIREKYFGQR
jgi:peptidoglycan/LPS O-acetylase OafA/YrhL